MSQVQLPDKLKEQLVKKLNHSFFIYNALFVALGCTLFNYRNLITPLPIPIGGKAASFASLYAFGHYFWLPLIILLLIAFVLHLTRMPKTALIVVGLFNGAVLSYVLADTFVWSQFRLHLNIAMLQMTFLGGREVVPFSYWEITEIVFLTILCFLVGFGLAFLARRLSIKVKNISYVLTCMLVIFLITIGFYGWSFAKEKTEYIVAAETVPVALPITFNHFLLNHGFLSKKEFARSIKTSLSSNAMNYPLNPLDCKGGKPLNLIILGIDSLRADELTPEIMPNTWKFAHSAIRFTDHWSGGIATRTGVFSLFTGLPASYWKSALFSKTPSILIQALMLRGYEINAFSSATLTHPEFDQTIFAGVDHLRVHSYGHNVFDRDRNAEDDFKYWVQKVPKDKNFFAFIFLDNVHDHAFPETPEYTYFEPYLDKVEYMKLPFTDAQEFFNRNKNAAHYADEAVGRILKFLEARHLLENTVIVITSDHGNEFDDNGQKYWEHNGNFTEFQAKVPLVIWWPGKKPETKNYRTSALDIVPTFLPELLGCKNPITDYSVGRSLWNSSERPFVYCSTYDKEAYIEPNRTVIIDAKGMMNFVDNHNRQSQDTSVPAYMSQVIQENSRYLKK